MPGKGFLIRGNLRPGQGSMSAGFGAAGPQFASGRIPAPPPQPNRIPSSLTINRPNRGPSGTRRSK